MKMGKLNQAADRFMAADERGDSPVINNNMGAVARMKGNLADAKRLLGSASGVGDAVKYNKGILAIQEGNYSQAISNFSGEATVNAALAKLLNGDANGAKTILDNAGDDSAVATVVAAPPMLDSGGFCVEVLRAALWFVGSADGFGEALRTERSPRSAGASSVLCAAPAKNPSRRVRKDRVRRTTCECAAVFC